MHECECRVSAASAGAYLRDAIAPNPPIALLSGCRLLPDGRPFPAFNDSCGNFAVLRAVIVDARERAQANLSCRIGGRTGFLIPGEPPHGCHAI